MRADHENARPFAYAGGPVGVLMLHGFTGTPAHLRPLGERIAATGCAVRAPLLPGHGTTLEDMNASNWRQWVACARSEYTALREGCEEVIVLGLSMGGTLAVLLAEEYPVDGLIALSPCIRMRQRSAWIAGAAAVFKPYVRWPESRRGAAEEGYDELREYNCGYSGLPVAKAYDLRRLVARTNASLFAVTAPTLILQSALDTTVNPSGAKKLYAGISSEQKTCLWLEKSRHLCTIGPERELVAKEVLEFIATVDSGKSACANAAETV